MATSSNPQIRDKFSPLDKLIKSAIRRFGDFSPASVSGDVQHMFLEFANLILEDYRQHPYFDGREKVHDYTSVNEAREIPDKIMLAGLIAHYSFQQMSEKTPGYQTLYYQTLNQVTWFELNGNTAIQIRPTDGGSNKEQSPETQVTNGLPVSDE